jgi:hypothetical protein
VTTYPSAPRIHGNGFIQIDLDERRRLHVWDHRIPRQSRDSSIHDHAFSFRSACVMGTLVNIVMEPIADPRRFGQEPTHRIYEVARVPGSEEDSLQPSDGWDPVRFDAAYTQIINAGEEYSLGAHEFHVSLHLGTTVTIMRRDPAYRGGGVAQVACRIGEEPDNSWVRGGHEVPDWALELIERYGGKVG